MVPQGSYEFLKEIPGKKLAFCHMAEKRSSNHVCYITTASIGLCLHVQIIDVQRENWNNKILKKYMHFIYSI